jgi:hypothetical protein
MDFIVLVCIISVLYFLKARPSKQGKRKRVKRVRAATRKPFLIVANAARREYARRSDMGFEKLNGRTASRGEFIFS